MAELSRQAGERGVDLLQLQRAPEEYPEMIQNFHLDGIIVLSAPAEFLPQLASYVEKGMNLVQVGVWHHDYCSFSFGTDHRLAAQQAVRYLLKKGRRNIGYIAGRQTNGEVHISNLMRIEGYQRGMWKARIPFNPDWILTDFITAPTLEQQLRQLIHNREMPDAFLLGNLPMAPRLYHILQNLHLRIPEDIALVTFDDALLCQQMTPALTAVNQNIPELVHRVFEKLLGTKMQEANHTNHGIKPIPTSFSERESC